jgi:hypothetical protein
LRGVIIRGDWPLAVAGVARPRHGDGVRPEGVFRTNGAFRLAKLAAVGHPQAKHGPERITVTTPRFVFGRSR